MSNPVRFALTNHAKTVLQERGISVKWVRRVLERPQFRIPDEEDPELLHAMAAIPDREDRVLRVVYNTNVVPWRIVTSYFDRAWRGKL